MIEDLLDYNAIGHIERQTPLDQILKISGQITLGEYDVFFLMHEHVRVIIERKVTAHHVEQNNAESPHSTGPRVEAMMQYILGRFIQIGAAKSAHRLVYHPRLTIAILVDGGATTLLYFVLVTTRVVAVSAIHTTTIGQVDHLSGSKVNELYPLGLTVDENVLALEVAVEYATVLEQVQTYLDDLPHEHFGLGLLETIALY